MNNVLKAAIIIITIALLGTTIVVVGALWSQPNPQNGTIIEVEGGTVTIDSILLASGEAYSWGALTVNTHTRSIIVTNDGNAPKTLTLTASPPTGMTLALSSPNPVIPAHDSFSGNLILTVDITAAEGSFDFDAAFVLT